MFMSFILHNYIIFGTNLLTEGPARIAIFCLFQCFEEKEYQTESKRNETFRSVIFGTNVIQGLGVQVKKQPRLPRDRRAPPLSGTPPTTWPPPLFLDVRSKSPGSCSVRKSRSRRFHSVWTPFDIPFLQNTEIGKITAIRAGPPVSRLVAKMIIMCKIKPINIEKG